MHVTTSWGPGVLETFNVGCNKMYVRLPWGDLVGVDSSEVEIHSQHNIIERHANRRLLQDDSDLDDGSSSSSSSSSLALVVKYWIHCVILNLIHSVLSPFLYVSITNMWDL